MVAPNEFSLRTEESEDRLQIVPAGELDLYTSKRFDSAIRAAEEKQPVILILDLRELTFIDSTGIRSLTRAVKRAKKRDVRLVLVRGPEEVQGVFRVCGIEQFFEMVDQPEDLLVS